MSTVIYKVEVYYAKIIKFLAIYTKYLIAVKKCFDDAKFLFLIIS